MKLNSPLSISLFTGLVVGLVVIAVSCVYSYQYTDNIEWDRALVSGAVAGLLSFGVFRASIKIFIQRKIKLINRIIHRSKIKEDPVVDIRKDVLHELTRDVKSWGDQKKERIEELEVQAEYRKEFVGNISHELRTPIFNIQGYVLSLLEGGLEDETINRKFLEKAEKSVGRMISIVEDLSSIAQFEKDGMKVAYRKTSLDELAKASVEAVEDLARENNVTVIIKKKENEGQFVLVDPIKIEQVFVNLLVNAIKYSSENGEVEIRFYNLDEGRLLIEIADNGIGIAEQHLPRLFERFYRVEESRSRDRGGSGLGLSIVKHIIDVHNETINVRSTVDVGTTFSFTLKKV